MSDIEDVASETDDISEVSEMENYSSGDEGLNDDVDETVNDSDILHNTKLDGNAGTDSTNAKDIDDESDIDEEEVYKIEKLQKDLSNFHTEHNLLSLDEIKPLLKIQRNNNNIIIDANHRSIPLLTKYEYTKAIGLRIIQLENGAKPFITVDKDIVDPFIIAVSELKEKKLPFIIRRPVSTTEYEYWPLEELELVV